MKKRWICMLLAVVLVLLLAVPVSADGGFNKDVVNSVVVVYSDIVYRGEYQYSSIGTGFFVGEKGKNPQYLVTNCHVVEDYLATGGENGESDLYVVYENDDYEVAHVVDYDAEMDLALLRIDTPTRKRQAIALEKPVNMVGDQVYAVGYPAVADDVVDAISYYGRQDATVTGGHVSRLLTEADTGRRLLQTDATIHSGNSGGPLVNTDGCVVGINTFILLDANGSEISGVYYAVSVEEVIPMLTRNRVDYQLGASTGSNMMTLILIGGAALVFVLVLVVVLVVVLTRKKPAPQPVQQAPKQPVIRSMSPQHGGRYAQLSAQPILIGRDAACLIAYADGTPGVSGRHCSIAWDPATGDFLLTDMGSTYGTFLSGGQKLTPGVPYHLRAGDNFYVGDRSNELRVELV